MAGPSGFGRVCGWIASRSIAPYHQRGNLARMSPRGFVAPSAVVTHPKLVRGIHVYIGDKTMIQDAGAGGEIKLMDHVHIYGDSFIESGMGGEIRIEDETHIQPGCHVHAFQSCIQIGRKVEIAAQCAFYSYNHMTDLGTIIMDQPLSSKGDIVVRDGAWIGHGVTVLSGVRIGEGAVIGAGSVVTNDVPDYAIAAGVPAVVVKIRGNPSGDNEQ